MPKKSEHPRTSEKTMDRGEDMNLLELWTEGYSAVTKMWEQSYVNLYNPWVESAGKLFDKAVELSKESTPDKYKEFYKELVDVQQNTLSKMYAVPKGMTDKETLENMTKVAQESNKLMKAWSQELTENTKRTQEMLTSGAAPENYGEFYDMWMKSYQKIIDQFTDLFASENMNEALSRYTGIPSALLTNYAELAKLWKQSYQNFISPLAESTSKLMSKFGDLTTKGEVSPEAYKEFYEQWMNTYREAYTRMFNFEYTQPSTEILESILKSTNAAMSAYKSWLAALEKMQGKMSDILSRTSDPDAYKGLYDLWVKTFEKAFDDLFEFMPTFGPMKETMDLMKKSARIQADAYMNVSKGWMETIARKQGQV
jgi:DNA-binding transcriptional regulator YbjK